MQYLRGCNSNMNNCFYTESGIDRLSLLPGGFAFGLCSGNMRPINSEAERHYGSIISNSSITPNRHTGRTRQRTDSQAETFCRGNSNGEEGKRSIQSGV